MTAFANDTATWSRLDFSLLGNGGVALYYAEAVLARDLEWLREERYSIREFNGWNWIPENSFHDDVAASLGFPDCYGRNLDALNDCMRDVEVPYEGGMAIVIHSVDAVYPDMEYFRNFVEILARHVRFNLLFGRRLLILLQSDNPTIGFSALETVSAVWNPRELLNSSRGL